MRGHGLRSSPATTILPLRKRKPRYSQERVLRGRIVFVMFMVLQIGHGEIILKPYDYYFSQHADIQCLMAKKDAEAETGVPMTCLPLEEKDS